MKRALLAFYGFLLLSSVGYSQKPAELLNQWYKKSPIEKVYLHFDRDNYLAGETLWFKAYLYSDYQPDTASSVLYVELFNGSSALVGKKILPVVLGVTNGQFELPDSLVTGNYSVRAWSPTMLNNGTDFIYRKNIFIFGKKAKEAVTVKQKEIRLEFFPEGGNFISGLSNTIAFKATDEKGMPAQVNGYINNSKNEKLTAFTTYHDGMGMLELTPEINEVYFAVLDGDIGSKKYQLPAPTDKGIVFTMIPHPQGGFFEIKQGTSDPSLKAAYMIGQIQHHVVFRQNFASAKGEVQGIINTEKLNSGILQVTVFNEDDIPLAERLFFVNNKEYVQAVSLRTDTLSFSSKGRNHFKILMPDTIQGSISVSVTDADYNLHGLREESIYSSLLLTSDLKGYIHNPSWYFLSDNDSVRTALDLLMMTNGWRRFKWSELARKVRNPLAYTDPAYITITGRVNLQGTKKPFAERPLVAIISAEGMARSMQMISTDKQGDFKLDSLLFFGNARIYLIDIRGRKSQYIDVNMTSDSLGKVYTVTSPVEQAAEIDKSPSISKQGVLAADYDAIQKANGLMLEGVTLKVRKKSPAEELDEKYTRGMFSGFSQKTIDLVNTEQYISENNIFDYLMSRVPGLDVTNDGVDYRVYYRQGPSLSSLGPIPMTLYLNEIETDANVISTIPATEIALVKVFSTFVGAAGGGAGGAMAIYTKKGSDISNSSRGDLITYKGFSVVKEFYAPNYKVEPELMSKADSRITLDWRPNIFINNINPVIPVSFYNSDRTKKFRVIVEGMTTSGKMISLEKLIESGK
ncbi:MAG: hypothetical protein JNK27_17070 [Chitinophagaceae bacterium]|nr:hypothetical protein [Chitinophagaceae bacterium]